MARSINNQRSISSLWLPIFCSSGNYWKSTWFPDMVTKELLMNILTMNNKSYGLLVCSRALDSAPWSARADGPKEHHFLGHTSCPVTCTSLVLLDISGWTPYPSRIFRNALANFVSPRIVTNIYLFWYILHYGLLQCSRQKKISAPQNFEHIWNVSSKHEAKRTGKGNMFTAPDPAVTCVKEGRNRPFMRTGNGSWLRAELVKNKKPVPVRSRASSREEIASFVAVHQLGFAIELNRKIMAL